MAKKTKEFRCPARDQMQALVNFKSNDSKALDISDDIKHQLELFHKSLNRLVQIKEREQSDGDNLNDKDSKGILTKAISFLFSTEYYNSQLDSYPIGQELSLSESHLTGGELVLYDDRGKDKLCSKFKYFKKLIN